MEARADDGLQADERNVAESVARERAAEKVTDPLLRASDSGRAIFVTSGITQRVVPYWGPYTIAKSALEAMVHMYAAEVAHTKVRANLINPGPMRTGLRAEAFPGEDPQTVPAPEQLAEAFVPLAQASCQLNGEWVAADEWLKAQTLQRQ